MESAEEPRVEAVVRIEEPGGAYGRRRVLARWSDGRATPAMEYFADEVLICEGDIIGKTVQEIRALHFGRDREFLQRDG